MVSAIVAVALTLVQLITGSEALALLFPWRISTYLVPLSTAILLAGVVTWLTRAKWMGTDWLRSAVVIISSGLIFLSVAVGIIRFRLDLERRAMAPEWALEAIVAETGVTGDVYLTPVKMQDFRLETGAAVVVDFKSIPYQPDEVLEWYRRVQLADRFYKSGDCAILAAIHLSTPVTHVVEDLSDAPIDCRQLEVVYEDDRYRLWRLK
jgi:hypothetical protein